MKKNQKITKNGYQLLGFPMETMYITQGVNGQFSHQGANALDNAGKDTGIEETYSPCDMKYVWNDSPRNGNAVFFQSVNKVLFADGTIDYATFMFIHDNYIADILNLARKGYVFKQGEPFGDEGTAAFATGNHSHIEVAKGKFTKPYILNSQGVYCLPNSVSPDKAFVTDGTNLRNGGQPDGSGAKMYWKTSKDVNSSKPSNFTKESATFTCTVDVLNVRDNPSLKGKVVAQYEKGQSFNYDGYVKADGYVWCHYISYSGKDRWVAVREISTNRPYGTFK